MNQEIKQMYDEVVTFYRKNVSLQTVFSDESKNDLQRKWLELVDHVYVMGTDETTNNCINGELIRQGLNIGITKLVIPKGSFLIEYFKNNSNLKLLYDWFRRYDVDIIKPYKVISLFGCHLSHALISEDMVSKGFNNVLVFEDDVCFKINIDVDYLNKLIYLKKYLSKKNNNIGYLNLGGYFTISDSTLKKINLKDLKTPYIIKTQSGLAQSYIINRSVAEKMKNSINTNLPMLSPCHSDFNKEQHYRGGADDFFAGFIKESYVVIPSITYQKFIGNNFERMTII